MVGGSIAGLTVGGLLFGAVVASGPFEFIHLSQLLTRFHFASLQDAGDDRSSKLFRFINHAKSGEVEKTRMGLTGNKIANNIEAKMNETGIQTAYTDKFGNLDGYVIDTSNEKFSSMSNKEVKQYFKENYNVDLVDKVDSAGHHFLFADGQKLGYFKSRAMIRAMMQESGFSKVSSALGARIMGRRAGISWHPLKKLDTRAQNALENWLKGFRDNIKNGSKPTIEAQKGSSSSNESQQEQADGTKAQQAAGDLSTEASKVDSADTKGISALQDNIHLKLAAGGAALVGVACLAYSVADHASALKQAEIVLPLMRMGMEAIVVGNQIMNGEDVNGSELNLLAQQFTSIDPNTGATLDWSDAQSFQAEQGEKITGVAASSTMQSVGAATPFGFLTKGSVGGALKAACSSVGQGIITVISFLGGPVSAAIGTVAGVIAGPMVNGFIKDLAGWLVGTPINPATLAGPDYGNAVNYGARLAANQQAIGAGGTVLSTTQAAALQSTENLASSQQFDAQNLAYRLFNPYDSRTLVAHMMDSVSPSIATSVASLSSGFLHIGSNIASAIGSIFTGSIHAAPQTPYNYGFPEYGFSQADLNNPILEDPYANAAAAATLLDNSCVKSDGTTNTDCSYIKKANSCFGVNIVHTPDSSAPGGYVWDVQDGGTAVDFSNNTTTNGCNDSSNAGGTSSIACNPSPGDTAALTAAESNPNCSPWLRIRFFIFDTENMDSIGCYENNAQACSSISMPDSTSVSYNQQLPATNIKHTNSGTFAYITPTNPLGIVKRTAALAAAIG